MYGAGPVVGYGHRHGWFIGGEAGGGAALAQGAVGYQTTGGIGYVRLDVGWDGPGVGLSPGEPSDLRGGGRIGGGFSFDTQQVRGGTFAVGGNAAWVFERDSKCESRSESATGWNTAVVGWLDVRYLHGEAQVVFTPRIERHQCVSIIIH